MKSLITINRILLGLLMLVAGLLKIFVSGVNDITSLLSKNILFSWAPMFWAWVLIIGEVGSGLAIIGKWNLKYTAFIPVIILVIAVITVDIKWIALGQTDWVDIIFNLIAINGYIMLSSQNWKK
ncbi:DoxX family protein [Candidatus Pacearchaeota archaeon]|nr:DoxX family protein [Candidatus Pacearchaeota archaeon]